MQLLCRVRYYPAGTYYTVHEEAHASLQHHLAPQGTSWLPRHPDLFHLGQQSYHTWDPTYAMLSSVMQRLESSLNVPQSAAVHGAGGE